MLPAVATGGGGKLVLHLPCVCGESKGGVSKKAAMRVEEKAEAHHDNDTQHADFHAAAVQHGNNIQLMHRGKSMKVSVDAYRAWRLANSSVKVIAEEGFEHDKDTVFEHTLSPLYRTFFSWRVVLLDGWWFDRRGTGLMTVHERLLALIEVATMSPCRWASEHHFDEQIH